MTDSCGMGKAIDHQFQQITNSTPVVPSPKWLWILSTKKQWRCSDLGLDTSGDYGDWGEGVVVINDPLQQGCPL